jgi:hypothetical protein
MGTKIQITITPNTEIMPLDQVDGAMARTIGTLQRLGIVPLRKITLAIECADGDAADVEDTIDAALSARPVGIEVVLKTTRERHVSRDAAMPRVTPMDEALRTPGTQAMDWLVNRETVGSDGPPRR